MYHFSNFEWLVATGVHSDFIIFTRPIKNTEGLNTSDIEALEKRSISAERAKEQIRRLKEGFGAIRLLRAATINDGIHRLNETAINEYLNIFSEESPSLNLLKFVPASGAATRMFKALYEDLPENDSLRKELLDNLEKLPFYEQLQRLIAEESLDIDQLKKDEPQRLFDYILQPHGLNFARFPKGLVPFHKYAEDVRTAFEEHLYEGASHCVGAESRVRIHFTVQDECMEPVKLLLEQKLKNLTKFDVSEFDISYSVQSPSTDTLALNSRSEPLCDSNGCLMFRPGGHGALLYNLNQQEADLIFIKNIDNILVDAYKYQSLLYKKVLGGMAIHLRRKVYRFCKAIDQNRASLSVRREMESFFKEWLNIIVPEEYTLRENKPEFLRWAYRHLNRPIRVCGMVKNEGEPGGGPFWVRDSSGRESLQIVEKSQVDILDDSQAEIMASSTHFNPVDLVCVTRNYKGESYDLMDFVDHETGFVSVKTHQGEKIKALELPGLWNGSMALWNTVFVEVPIATFSPVKTVNDLLRPLHQ